MGNGSNYNDMCGHNFNWALFLFFLEEKHIALMWKVT